MLLCRIKLTLSLCLQYEYFNAVLINEVDELGNNVELGGEFILQPNDHFSNLSVNLSLSVVQVPTNMYNKGAFAVSKYSIYNLVPFHFGSPSSEFPVLLNVWTDR